MPAMTLSCLDAVRNVGNLSHSLCDLENISIVFFIHVANVNNRKINRYAENPTTGSLLFRQRLDCLCILSYF